MWTSAPSLHKLNMSPLPFADLADRAQPSGMVDDVTRPRSRLLDPVAFAHRL